MLSVGGFRIVIQFSTQASIVGFRTMKVLYIGVKNKFCFRCALAARSRVQTEHTCFKNYTGFSTGMETVIVEEGFACSKEMHGLIFSELVGTYI